MPDKDIRLVAVDLDGTLFNDKKEISEENKKAIREAVAAGIEVVVSTGRPYVGLPLAAMEELGMRYAITTNGAAVYKVPEKERIFADVMEQQPTIDLIRNLLKYHVHFDVFIQGDGYCQKDRSALIEELALPDIMRSYIRDTRVVVDDFIRFLEDPKNEVEKMTINFFLKDQTLRPQDGDELFIPKIEAYPDSYYGDHDEVEAYLASNTQFTSLCGGYHNIEVTKAGVRKSTGLRFLTEKLGISMEQTMAIGDTENDLDILEHAGLGVAMANATDAVKARADVETLSNKEDGVAYAIRKYALSNPK